MHDFCRIHEMMTNWCTVYIYAVDTGDATIVYKL